MHIKTEDLSLCYPGGKTALAHLNLELSSPGLIGLLGPNGAGKSTLMKLLAAALLPTAGKIYVDGSPLQTEERRLKARLGYLPQEFGLYGELTVYQFLDYMAALKGIRNAKSAVRGVIREVHLEEKERAKIRTLSGGQRQRVGIAQALLGDPELLIFDEPTVGLDPEERIYFRNLFSQAAKERLVLLGTHIIEDVQSVCGRLLVVNGGEILFDGPPGELIRRARGHVGTFVEQRRLWESKLRVTARVNTGEGVRLRAVADTLPSGVLPAEPTLEDAYLYLTGKEDSR